jgi:L-threonylcarbamoyladenylate synthase
MAGIDIKRAADLLNSGETAAFSTDTVNGMGVLYDNEESIERIFELKKRDKGKPFSLFFYSKNQVFEFFRKSKLLERVIDSFLPGPLTIVSHPKRVLCSLLVKDNMASFRIPKNAQILNLLKRLDRPMAVTSLNVSGEKIIDSEEEAFEKIKEIFIYGSLKKGVKPSTVVRISNGRTEILREGVLSKEDFYKGINKHLK